MAVMNILRVAALALLLSACGADDRGAAATPAPIGDNAALEKLAASYESIMERLPGSPWMLAPADRKHFVETVFADSGYHYGATLLRMAEGGWPPEDQAAKDLAELLFMPHTNLGPGQLIDDVYTDEELAAVRKVQAMLK